MSSAIYKDIIIMSHDEKNKESLPTISSWEAFNQTYSRAWNRLQEVEKWPPDSTRLWAEALIHAHDLDVSSLSTLSWSENCGSLGFIPIYKERLTKYGIPIRKIGPLFNAFCIRHNLLSTESTGPSVNKILDVLCGELKSWDILLIDKVHQSGEVFSAWVHGLQSHGLNYEVKLGERSPYLKIECGWDDYLSGKSRNFRYNLKRKRKKLESAGKLEIAEYTCESHIRTIMQAIDQIEQGSWKKHAGTAIISRPWERRFYEYLLSGMAKQGQLHCTILFLDRQPIAYDVSLIRHGVGYCLKTSFHGDFSALSPGLVLREHVMKKVFDLGLNEYDFLGNDERYKLEWSSTVRQHVSILIYNHNMRGRLLSVQSRVGKYIS